MKTYAAIIISGWGKGTVPGDGALEYAKHPETPPALGSSN
jgi:hypothetical protein